MPRPGHTNACLNVVEPVARKCVWMHIPSIVATIARQYTLAPLREHLGGGGCIRMYSFGSAGARPWALVSVAHSCAGVYSARTHS